MSILKINITNLFILFSLVLSFACTMGVQDYDKAYLDMSLQEFQGRFREAKKIREVQKDNGSKVLELSVPSKGPVKKTSFFFDDEILTGMVITYGKGQDYDSLVSKLTDRHGKPILNKTIDKSRGANWRNPGSYITLLQGVAGTKVKLPVGETDVLRPEETILIIGKRTES